MPKSPTANVSYRNAGWQAPLKASGHSALCTNRGKAWVQPGDAAFACAAISAATGPSVAVTTNVYKTPCLYPTVQPAF